MSSSAGAGGESPTDELRAERIHRNDALTIPRSPFRPPAPQLLPTRAHKSSRPRRMPRRGSPRPISRWVKMCAAAHGEPERQPSRVWMPRVQSGRLEAVRIPVNV